MINKTEGLIAAPFTPLGADGRLNLDVVASYASKLQQDGVVGAFICGTTGEGMSLTTNERCQLAERWVQVAPDGLQVIVHVGHNSLTDACELAAHAQRIGADSIACMSPTFFKPLGIEGLVTWCQRVAQAAPDLPFYYYHIPSMTGVNVPVNQFLKLAGPRIPNLVGAKFTYEDLNDFQQCLQQENGKYDMLFGRDELFLIDLFPTLNDLCELPPVDGLEGQSLVPLLKEPTINWDRPALTTHGRRNHALRTECWRYIRYSDGGEELYDHTSDPNEWINLATKPEFASVKAELSKQLPMTDAPNRSTKAKRKKEKNGD